MIIAQALLSLQVYFTDTEVKPMAKANIEIRKLARANEVPLWAIANKLKIAESTLIRWLRLPLDGQKETAIRKIIVELSGLKVGE
jgi:hypothetical protein